MEAKNPKSIGKAWCRRIEGCLKFAEDLKYMGIFENDGWGRGNYRHYRNEVIEMLKLKVPGVAPQRRDFEARLKKLPAA